MQIMLKPSPPPFQTPVYRFPKCWSSRSVFPPPPIQSRRTALDTPPSPPPSPGRAFPAAARPVAGRPVLSAPLSPPPCASSLLPPWRGPGTPPPLLSVGGRQAGGRAEGEDCVSLAPSADTQSGAAEVTAAAAAAAAAACLLACPPRSAVRPLAVLKRPGAARLPLSLPSAGYKEGSQGSPLPWAPPPPAEVSRCPGASPAERGSHPKSPASPHGEGKRGRGGERTGHDALSRRLRVCRGERVGGEEARRDRRRGKQFRT